MPSIAPRERSFNWLANFVTTQIETTYLDRGYVEKKANSKPLDASTAYSYQVTAVNSGGVSPPSVVEVPAR